MARQVTCVLWPHSASGSAFRFLPFFGCSFAGRGSAPFGSVCFSSHAVTSATLTSIARFFLTWSQKLYR